MKDPTYWCKQQHDWLPLFKLCSTIKIMHMHSKFCISVRFSCVSHDIFFKTSKTYIWKLDLLSKLLGMLNYMHLSFKKAHSHTTNTKPSITRSQGLMTHLIHLCISFAIPWDPLPIPSWERIGSGSILNLWLAQRDHMIFGSRSPLGRGSGWDLEQILSLFWASYWLRDLTWLRERSRGDWEGIWSGSPLYSEPLIGLDRSHMGSAPDPLRKFVTFDSISTSDDESDVLKSSHKCKSMFSNAVFY